MYYSIIKIASKAPLKIILIVSFVLQVVGTVGLVGYLSFRNGQKAVNKLADQLINQSSDRLTKPPSILPCHTSITQ